mgnify:CR=1 FL=1
MPRPKNKTELLDLSQANFDKLMNHVNALDAAEQERTFPEGTLNRNIRDVLGHLHHWHLMMLHWYEVGMKGEKPEIPAKGYTWKTTGDLNREIQRQYAKTPLEEVKGLLSGSHDDVRGLIAKHNNDELFEKKRYRWTGSTSLGAYLISATSSHYDWALKLIKKCRKSA